MTRLAAELKLRFAGNPADINTAITAELMAIEAYSHCPDLAAQMSVREWLRKGSCFYDRFRPALKLYDNVVRNNLRLGEQVDAIKKFLQPYARIKETGLDLEAINITKIKTLLEQINPKVMSTLPVNPGAVVIPGVPEITGKWNMASGQQLPVLFKQKFGDQPIHCVHFYQYRGRPQVVAVGGIDKPVVMECYYDNRDLRWKEENQQVTLIKNLAGVHQDNPLRHFFTLNIEIRGVVGIGSLMR